MRSISRRLRPASLLTAITFSPSSGRVETKPELPEAPDRDQRQPLKLVSLLQAEARQAPDQGGYRDADLETCERRADAAVNALAEGQVRAGRGMLEVEAGLEALRILIGGGEHDDQRGTGWDRHSGDCGLAR